jgi:nitrogen fixation/metabolism regulation signal transduction histidine kinase
MPGETATRARVRDAVDFALALAIALPPAAVALWPDPAGRTWTVVGGAVGVSALLAWWSRSVLARRLRTMSAVVASFREGDFSVRTRVVRGGALFEDVLGELNQLGDALRGHRLAEIEAWALLRKVMAEIDVVVLALDEHGRVRLANDAAARILALPSTALVGKSAVDLGLSELLAGDVPRTVKECPPLGPGQWELRRGPFRLSGRLHALVVLSDVSGALREQEREAWKRLIRVMSHEINNSLAPIQSIAENVVESLSRSPRADDWEQDVKEGMSIVGRRVAALGRFTGAYAQLARLPRPKLAPVSVADWVRRTAGFEARLPVEVVTGPDVFVLGDADQLDQLLINLLKNAVDATLGAGAGGGVRLRWTASARVVTLAVDDDGPGIGDTTNLFVPFFTTKPGGSGVGLVLARQIAEAHGGQVSLKDRPERRGAEATVWLPVAPTPDEVAP